MTWQIEAWYDDKGVKYWEVYDDNGNHIKHYDNANHSDNTSGIDGLRLPQDIRGLVFDQHQLQPAGFTMPIISRRGLEIVLDRDWQIVRRRIT